MRTVSALYCFAFISLLSLPVSASIHLVRPLSMDAMRIWNTQDGLPHNTINHIHQDSQGYLWLATWEGPVRFDGRHFAVYGAESGIPDVSTLFVTSHPSTDEIVATGGRGSVSHFNGQSWFTKPRISNRVDVVLYEANGQIWYGTVDEGVVLERPDGSQRYFSTEQGLPSTMVLHLSLDSSDNLWVGTNRGVALFNPYQQRFEQPQGLPTAISFSIEEDSAGTIWAAVGTHIYRRRLNDSDFEQVPVTFPSTITELHFDARGRLWVGTHEHGITELRQANINGEPLQFTTTETGLPNNHVIDIFSDRENSLWLGTHGGLVQFRRALAHSHTQQDGLDFQFTRALANLDSQRVLVAGLGGISVIQNERISPYAIGTSVGDESILSLAVDGGQRVYIGTFTNGIFVLENEEVIAHYDESNGFPGNDVRDILLTHDGHLFATTAIGLLVAVRNPDGTLSDPQYFGSEQGLPDQVVYAVHEDQAGIIWIGSMRGISQFQRRDESAQSLVQFIDISAISSSEFVFQIREDSNYVWFATDRGLVAWSKSSETW
ncbi:MAG TPA: two-component regulator propeller domain-containing protein, partial [Pseudidiomarina sp.]|nr:two-component regulator propeller domain-containing protein [Pseudidiomarina sp.]